MQFACTRLPRRFLHASPTCFGVNQYAIREGQAKSRATIRSGSSIEDDRACNRFPASLPYLLCTWRWSGPLYAAP
jgi:hypothetical protein